MCECTHILTHTHTSINLTLTLALTGTLTLTHTDQAMTVVTATVTTMRATATDRATGRDIEEIKRQIREIRVSGCEGAYTSVSV